MALEPNLPPDPFGLGPDLTQFGVNCMAMIKSLTAAGMEPARADRFVAVMMAAMLAPKTP